MKNTLNTLGVILIILGLFVTITGIIVSLDNSNLAVVLGGAIFIALGLKIIR